MLNFKKHGKYLMVCVFIIASALIVSGCTTTIPTPGGEDGGDGTTNVYPVVTIGSQTNGQVVPANYTIGGDVTDDKAGSAVYVKINNGSYVAATMATPTNWSRSVTLTTKGSNTNYVYAVDSDGCSSETNMLIVNYFSDVPVVMVDNLADMCVTNYSTVNLSGTATVDSPSYIVKVEISVNGGAYSDVGNTNWTKTGVLFTVGVTNTVQVRAISDTGKTNGTSAIRVIVVSAAPEVYQFVSKWTTTVNVSLARDSAGNIYVCGSSEIRKYTSSGTFITNWGSSGSNNGQFNNLRGIAADASGNIYVSDSGNNRVQKFTSSGVFVTNWGTSGSGNNQFNNPYGIAVDSAGNVYVADTINSRIVKYTSDGTYIKKWGTLGAGNGQFYLPMYITVDGTASVYVTDSGRWNVQKFDTNGTYITKWGSNGDGNNQFCSLFGIAVDGSGYVYTVDASTNRVQKFTSDGAFVAKWGSYGFTDGYFSFSCGIVIDPSYNVYILDGNNFRVQIFNKP